jgi:putative protease
VRNARGRQDKNHILKMPLPGSIVASVSPDELMKTLPKRKGA